MILKQKKTFWTVFFKRRTWRHSFQFDGVTYHYDVEKWRASLYHNGNEKIGGDFATEIEAARRVNDMCKRAGIDVSNPQLVTAVVFT